jgi:hypothetical protein
MARANFLWGAPRIHGEVLKLGITISQATVSRYMPVPRGRHRSQTWRTFVRNQATAIVCNRTFEGLGWIDNIRSWSRVVRYRAATFAATALAGPPSSRTWYLARARSLIVTHQRVPAARDEDLRVSSAVSVARPITPAACTVHLLTAGWIRGPPRRAHTQSASCLRYRSHGFALLAHRSAAPPSANCRLMRKIAEHRIAIRDQPVTHYILDILGGPTVVVVSMQLKF